jgi:hypothetical protein
MSIKYDDLAIELQTKIGDLTALAETLNLTQGFNLPFAAKATLTNEEAEQLRKAFREQPKPTTAPQLNPAPVRNNDIQATEPSNVPITQDPDPTAAELETVHSNLDNAIGAAETQEQELFEDELNTIGHEEFRLGAMQAIYAETRKLEGFMAGKNALAVSKKRRSAESLKRRAKQLAGTEGADFLQSSYPNAAESSTKIPEATPSIAQPTLDILDRVKKS